VDPAILLSDAISIENFPSFQITTAGDSDKHGMFHRLCKRHFNSYSLLAELVREYSSSAVEKVTSWRNDLAPLLLFLLHSSPGRGRCHFLKSSIWNPTLLRLSYKSNAFLVVCRRSYQLFFLLIDTPAVSCQLLIAFFSSQNTILRKNNSYFLLPLFVYRLPAVIPLTLADLSSFEVLLSLFWTRYYIAYYSRLTALSCHVWKKTVNLT